MARSDGMSGRAKPWLRRHDKIRAGAPNARNSKDAAFGRPVMERLPKRDVLEMAAEATKGLKSGKSVGPEPAPNRSFYDMPASKQGFKNPLA